MVLEEPVSIFSTETLFYSLFYLEDGHSSSSITLLNTSLITVWCHIPENSNPHIHC